MEAILEAEKLDENGKLVQAATPPPKRARHCNRAKKSRKNLVDDTDPEDQTFSTHSSDGSSTGTDDQEEREEFGISNIEVSQQLLNLNSFTNII